MLDLIFGSVIINKKTLEKKSLGYKVVTNGPEMFFLETILVTPNSNNYFIINNIK